MGQKTITLVDAVLKTYRQTKNNERCYCLLQKGCCRQTSQLQKIRSHQSRQKRIQSQHGRYAGFRPEKKYECLSYLPPLSDEDIAKQVVYLVNQGWSPCIEFASQEEADTNQLFFAGPALYENRYWTMWKLPLFGCSDPQQVLNEIEECQKEYPGCRVRVGIRQIQTGPDGWLHRQKVSCLETIIIILSFPLKEGRASLLFTLLFGSESFALFKVIH